jgi:hypothetical protein
VLYTAAGACYYLDRQSPERILSELLETALWASTLAVAPFTGAMNIAHIDTKHQTINFDDSMKGVRSSYAND